MIKRTISSRRCAAIVAAAAAASFAGSTAHAQTAVDWVGAAATQLPYVNGGNWTSGVTPTNAANEFLTINNGGIATVTGTEAAEGSFLHLGLQPGQSGQLMIDGGTLTLGEFRVGGRETVLAGDPPAPTPNGGGTGTVTQTGGTVSVTYVHPTAPAPIQSLYIGDAGLVTEVNTAAGSYNISGTGVLLSGIANDDAIVVGTGTGTTGTFTQAGTSTVTSTGFLTVARGGATASYSISSGTLQVGSTGLAHSTNMNLRIGDGEYPTAVPPSYQPGTSGTFTQTGGTVTVRNDTTVGRNSGTGALSITGDTSVYNAENNINVGHGGNGSVVQGAIGLPGPTVNVGKVVLGTKGMSVGISQTATLPGSGTYTLNSGTLSVGNTESADYLAVGDGAFGTGTFTMEGGTITVSDLVQVGRNNSAADNRFNFKAGTITSKRMVIGGGSGATGGRGTFTMTGGSYTGSEPTNLGFGGNNNTSVGVLDIQGGNYTLSGTGSNGIMAIGNTLGGTGTVLLSGGTLSVEGATSVIDIGRNNSGGSFTLSGTGNLKALHLRGADRSAGTGARTITFNGGTSTITTLTLGNVGTMTVNGGTHSIGTTNFSTGSTFTTNADLTLPVANFGNTTLNVGAGATLTLNTVNTNSAPRTIIKGGDGTLVIDGTQTHFAGTTVQVNAGTYNENSNPNGRNLTSSATSNLNAPVSRINVLTVNGGTTKLASGETNIILNTTVALSGTGRLDLNNGKMITTSAAGTATEGVYNGLQGQVQTAYNFGSWDAPGLMTSQADALAGIATVGVATGEQIRGLGPTDTDIWGGQTINGASTIAMYTYAGDANLDGQVDAGDYGILDAFIQVEGATGYANGDYNYDGFIDAADYGTIDNSIQFQGPPIATSGSAAGLAGVTAVPEPASLSVLAVAAAGLLTRRRRGS